MTAGGLACSLETGGGAGRGERGRRQEAAGAASHSRSTMEAARRRGSPSNRYCGSAKVRWPLRAWCRGGCPSPRAPPPPPHLPCIYRPQPAGDAARQPPRPALWSLAHRRSADARICRIHDRNNHHLPMSN